MAETWGIIGAVMAALATYVLGRRRDREATLRAEQISASIAFCEAVMDYSATEVKHRRAELRRRQDHDPGTDQGPEEVLEHAASASVTDDAARDRRSKAWAAYFRVVLLVGTAEATLCMQALDAASKISATPADPDQVETELAIGLVKKAGEDVRKATEKFAEAMAHDLGARKARPASRFFSFAR